MKMQNSGIYSLENLMRRYGKQPRGCAGDPALPSEAPSSDEVEQPTSTSVTTSGNPCSEAPLVRSPDESGQWPKEKGRTLVFAGLPLVSDNGIRPSSVEGRAPVPSARGDEAKHNAEPGAPAILSPVAGRQSKQTRGAHSPTQLFVVAPSLSAVRDTAGGGEPSQLAQNATRGERAATPPLLRAFDDAKRGEATRWTTAKTLAEAVTQVDAAEAVSKAEAGSVKRGEPRPPLPYPQRLLGGLRPFSALSKQTWVFVGAAAVVCLGLLVEGWSRSITDGTPRSSVAVGDGRAAPREIGTSAKVASATSVEAQPGLSHSPISEGADERPSRASDDGLTSVTTARQAVDALLAGDRSTALLRYRELSRTEPDRKVYRQAVHLLTLPASDTSR